MNKIRCVCLVVLVTLIISCIPLKKRDVVPAATLEVTPVPHEVVKSPVVVPPQAEPKKEPKVDPMEAIYEADRLLQEKFAPSPKKGN